MNVSSNTRERADAGVDPARPAVAEAFLLRNELIVWGQGHGEVDQTEHSRGGAGTRSQVLDSAVDLFAERGFEATTMKDLAHAGGVKAPALYNYFSSKEQILSEAMQQAMTRFVLAVVGPLEKVPLSGWLESIVRSHTRLQLSNPGHQNSREMLLRAETLGRHLPDASYEEMVWAQRQYVNLMRALIDIHTDGRLRSGESTVAAFSFIAMMDRSSAWFKPGGPQGIEQVCSQLWRFALAMMDASTDAHGVSTNQGP